MEGLVAAGFESVAAAFAEAQSRDAGGAQLCVYRHGEPVVDIWAGSDVANGRSYAGDSLTVIMSVTKGVVALLAHRLAEQARLDLDAPVARYWPEFAGAGKAEVTVAELLAHRAGLAGFEVEERIGANECLDWARCTAALARMTPLWKPGDAYLYHFITWGYLVGEVIQRATGQPLGQLVAEEMARPLNLDLWIGLPEALEPRVAPHFRANARLTEEGLLATFAGLGIDVESRVVRTMVDTMVCTESLIDLLAERAGRAACLPAANAVANAHALARLLAACIGEVDGVRLLSSATVERVRRPRTDHLLGPPPFDQPVPHPQRFGLGLELPRATLPMLGDGSFGHPGAGGRLAFAHPESGIAAAYICNALVWDGNNPDPRWTWMEPLRTVVHGGR